MSRDVAAQDRAVSALWAIREECIARLIETGNDTFTSRGTSA
jgi:hypothetical protein